MKIVIGIPARYGSTRFVGKPLAKIGGQSMIERVLSVARRVASEVRDVAYFVATDDKRIEEHVRRIGAPCYITPENCRSGSDRVLAAVTQLDEKPDFVINLQGDAPFTPPEVIIALITAFRANSSIDVFTPVHQLTWDALDLLREAKKVTPFSGTTVIVSSDDAAIWFSKNIIPAIRNESRLREGGNELSPVYQHLGVYGFRVDSLETFCNAPLSHYELLEGLEQLRILEAGMRIQAVRVNLAGSAFQSGIDTPEDLERVEKSLREGGESF